MKENLEKVVHEEYLPYAKSTIIGRAITAIDGLKPSQRRVIYALSKDNLLGSDKKRKRSSSAAGKVGLYHPHGDASCYETMVYMSQRRGGLNVPYIDGKGNFGDVREPESGYGAPRYTEVRLSDVCKYIVSGIEDDAVDMVDNFDGTLKEPVLLPVRFPNILVNSNPGIAVAISSNVPSYSLRNVCLATAGVMMGTITTDAELAEALGVPEFPTGGIFHATKDELVQLVKTGEGSFPLTATAEVYSDKIVIRDIPYTTSVENIKDAVEKAVKEKLITEISDLKDEIGYKKFMLTIKLKRGSDARDVLSRLYRLTPLRCNISFKTCVIIGDEYKYMGIMELINEWLKWRMSCIDRVYNKKLKTTTEKEKCISAWEVINDRTKEAANIIVDSLNKKSAVDNLKKVFGMTDEQAEYIAEEKTYRLTQEEVKKHIEELRKLREDMKSYSEIIDSEEVKKKLILNDLVEVNKQFGTRPITKLGEKLASRSEEVVERKISTADVTIIYTKQGYIKRLERLSSLASFRVAEGDEEVMRMSVKNNEYLLALTSEGDCYKVLADDIDSSNGLPKVKLHNMLGLESEDSIIKVMPAGDYSQKLTILYPTGKAQIVSFSKCQGKRKKYLSLFEPVTKDRFWFIEDDKIFIVTAPKGESPLTNFKGVKAVYVDFGKVVMLSERNKLRLIQASSRDVIAGIISLKNVAHPELINLEYYAKVYPCRIDFDLLVDLNKKSEEKTEVKSVNKSDSVDKDTSFDIDISKLESLVEEDDDD